MRQDAHRGRPVEHNVVVGVDPGDHLLNRPVPRVDRLQHLSLTFEAVFFVVRQNGIRVFEQTGLTFRTTPSLRIEGLFFSTFFGGGDASWATPRDQYADFAGFELAIHRISG